MSGQEDIDSRIDDVQAQTERVKRTVENKTQTISEIVEEVRTLAGLSAKANLAHLIGLETKASFFKVCEGYTSVNGEVDLNSPIMTFSWKKAGMLCLKVIGVGALTGGAAYGVNRAARCGAEKAIGEALSPQTPIVVNEDGYSE